MQQLMTIARWLARKAIKEEWRRQGRRVQYVPAAEVTKATNLYLELHRWELMKQAWEHPVSVRYRERERMSLARKAVIAEIRHNGRKVRSIAPAELQRLIESYLRDHPEESAFLRECGCH